MIVGGRTVIIWLEEGGRLLKFRRKGMRTEGWATLPIETAYWQAADATWSPRARDDVARKRRN